MLRSHAALPYVTDRSAHATLPPSRKDIAAIRSPNSITHTSEPSGQPAPREQTGASLHLLLEGDAPMQGAEGTMGIRAHRVRESGRVRNLCRVLRKQGGAAHGTPMVLYKVMGPTQIGFVLRRGTEK